MDFRLSEEQMMMRTMVRDFAQNEVKPLSVELDAKRDPKECIPWDLIKKASQSGLRTLSIPEKYGGGGADYVTLAIVLEESGLLTRDSPQLSEVVIQSRPGYW